ncbi:hypothetical protein M4D56_11635 [Cytobacillus oceanisediminis]|jgi:hypothetical protein|uniref:hypothetical protein n=1 Tax=Cytobacillus TaxID=2675230 RepID=UPI001C21B222|nr:hypothetical protein [Cytobacillus oceanisediminis]MBY0154489.1 hypothetical protein [Cytobacillus firmus]MBU8731277.1 hypothetical protein [Cytobacillus oceanisediminis]MCM3394111.1 hypothetical protein [Cytobacillus oceanisediminis]MCM3529738.1 hypothetical protein [Cytobacillus oceanisediminis]MCS0823684.1 hypothetical protein [Cytobacillus firmus]
MKKLGGVLLSILVIYVIFYDLNHGTLPAGQKQALEASSLPTETGEPYFEKKVNPGETVLSIIELNLDGPIPVAIDQVVSDFSELNNGMQPEDIKSGTTYKFPKYTQDN